MNIDQFDDGTTFKCLEVEYDQAHKLFISMLSIFALLYTAAWKMNNNYNLLANK